MSASLKSIPAMNRCASSSRPMPSEPNPINASEKTNATAISPIVIGKPSQRWFT